eukprot:3817541-Pyramimonas_sp.AAC.1
MIIQPGYNNTMSRLRQLVDHPRVTAMQNALDTGHPEYRSAQFCSQLPDHLGVFKQVRRSCLPREDANAIDHSRWSTFHDLESLYQCIWDTIFQGDLRAIKTETEGIVAQTAGAHVMCRYHV